jgi:hypothetical protein
MNNQSTQYNLEQNYNILNEERNKIQKIKKEFETLNSASENSELVATSNYYRFIALFFLSILLIFLLIKFAFTGQQVGGGNNFKNEAFFLFSIMLISLCCAKIFNIYDNVVFFFVLVITYIILKIKMHQ